MAPLWRMFVNKFDPGFVFQFRKFSFVLTPISCSRFFSTGNNNNKNNVGTETSTSGLWHINRYWKQAKTTTELRAHFRAQLFDSQYKNLEVETRGDNEDVALIRLNRPKAMNALNDDLITELNCALIEAEADEDVGAIVITGSERAFSVGADIEDMSKKAYQQVLETEFANFEAFKKSRKPVIAAVNGYALGGGCELAMLCDIIYAGEKAQFAQPEIILGTIPGVGGTQRLLRAIGKSKAMEMVLTGNRLSAHEAEKAGLVSKVFPPGQLVDETVKVAEGIAERSRLIAAMCKECLNKGYDLSLAQGTHFEKRNFHATFSTHDKKEGMEAFVQKRKPVFKYC